MPDPILRDAYDLHIHCGPDIVPRAQSAAEIAKEATAAGMAGIGLKDHTSDTAGVAHALNALLEGPTRFYGTITLNPSLGGLNPLAASAALKKGARLIWLSTYGTRQHRRTWGSQPFGLPPDDEGYTVWVDDDEDQKLRPEIDAIIDLAIEHGAILASGHFAVDESLAVFQRAADKGLKRLMLTHATEAVTDMSIDDQRRVVEMGAFVEHCFLVASDGGSGFSTYEKIAQQIQELGADHVILTSDYGNIKCGPVVEGFAKALRKLMTYGITEDQIRRMIVDNPRQLIEG